MLTFAELSALDPQLLAAALEAARKREVNERLANLPTCACGARATQVCMTQVSYVLARIHTDEELGSARTGRWEEDWGGGCPGEGAPDDGVVWVCCDADACVERDWRPLRYGELNGLCCF
jgi:hypothetical protein